MTNISTIVLYYVCIYIEYTPYHALEEKNAKNRLASRCFPAMPVQKNKKEIKLVLSQVAGYSDLLSLSGNLPQMTLNTCFFTIVNHHTQIAYID